LKIRAPRTSWRTVERQKRAMETMASLVAGHQAPSVAVPPAGRWGTVRVIQAPGAARLHSGEGPAGSASTPAAEMLVPVEESDLTVGPPPAGSDGTGPGGHKDRRHRPPAGVAAVMELPAGPAVRLIRKEQSDPEQPTEPTSRPTRPAQPKKKPLPVIPPKQPATGALLRFDDYLPPDVYDDYRPPETDLAPTGQPAPGWPRAARLKDWATELAHQAGMLGRRPALAGGTVAVAVLVVAISALMLAGGSAAPHQSQSREETSPRVTQPQVASARPAGTLLSPPVSVSAPGVTGDLVSDSAASASYQVPGPIAVRVDASGRCWVEVRSGGPYGPILYQGMLVDGQTWNGQGEL
jgi:hypothetical protein